MKPFLLLLTLAIYIHSTPLHSMAPQPPADPHIPRELGDSYFLETNWDSIVACLRAGRLHQIQMRKQKIEGEIAAVTHTAFKHDMRRLRIASQPAYDALVKHLYTITAPPELAGPIFLRDLVTHCATSYPYLSKDFNTIPYYCTGPTIQAITTQIIDKNTTETSPNFQDDIKQQFIAEESQKGDYFETYAALRWMELYLENGPSPIPPQALSTLTSPHTSTHSNNSNNSNATMQGSVLATANQLTHAVNSNATVQATALDTANQLTNAIQFNRIDIHDLDMQNHIDAYEQAMNALHQSRDDFFTSIFDPTALDS